MTSNPSLDIIVPVWNHPFQARSCLVSILNSSDEARLIIINNGSNRETELMLEEFSDHLGDRVLYMTMERNIGFVPAVNRGLERSTADWAFIIRPTGSIYGNCLDALKTHFSTEDIGILSPFCQGETSFNARSLKPDCTLIETCQLSFAGIAISKRLRDKAGLFDEGLDGGDWCLRDYHCRADHLGFKSFLVPGAVISSGDKLVFGSSERRLQIEEHSTKTFYQRWGSKKTFALHIPKEAEAEHLKTVIETVMDAARQGHCFKVFIHRQQLKQANQLGLCCQHTGISLIQLSMFGSIRDLNRQMANLSSQHPDLIAIKAVDGIPFPGCANAMTFSSLKQIAARQEAD